MNYILYQKGEVFSCRQSGQLLYRSKIIYIISLVTKEQEDALIITILYIS